jgi:peroxiredoxin Q/BCP
MKKLFLTAVILVGFSLNAQATNELKVGDAAPLFSSTTQDGKTFSLKSRTGTWTVLYFYPKAGTPGCTKQACGFRDDIKKIELEGAEVFGVSADSVKEQKAFHEKHHLNFTLIADEQDRVVDLYGSKMTGLKMSKRWTFIIGPDLTIRDIQKDVDPVMDAKRTAKRIAELKKI